MSLGAHYQINQASNSPANGTVDLARTDIRVGQSLHLVGDSSSGQVSPVWTILAWPPGSSRTQPTNRTTFDATYTPDVPGSYRIQLNVNAGLGSDTKTFIFRATRDANGLIIDDTLAEPAFGELAGEDNSATNDRGYAQPYEATMAAHVPSIANMAALLLRKGSRHKAVNLQGYYTAGDGGGGSFIWNSTSTATHDGGVCVQPGHGTGAALATGRWIRQFSGPINAEWFGVRADGVRLLDGSVTAGSHTLTSASAPFTPADVGKSVLALTPSTLATGTVSFTSGTRTGTGTGTNFAVDIPNNPDGLAKSGAIYAGGHLFTIYAYSGTAIQLNAPAEATVTNAPYYTETQLATTITAYISPTQVTLADAATISQTGVNVFYATDDTSATQQAITVAAATTKQVLFPRGLIGHSGNLVFNATNGLVIEGAGRDATIFTDLRRASFEYTYPIAGNAYCAFNFTNGQRTILRGFSYDGSVPIRTMNITEGGMSNGTGGRGGFFFYINPDSQFLDMGLAGFGSRDGYMTGQASYRMLVQGCHLPTPNTVAVNPNGAADGWRIVNNYIGSSLLVTGNGYVIEGNIITCTEGIGGSITVDTQGHGIVANNTIHDLFSYGSGAIDVFGTLDTTATLSIHGNTIYNVHGQYQTGTGVIALRNFAGTASIYGNTIEGAVSDATGGVGIYIAGASTGTVVIGPNVLGPGTNMTIGYHVHSDVPSGKVKILPGSVFDSTYTTRVQLQANLGRVAEQVTVSATGTTALAAATESALVTANGAVTLTLVDPRLVPDRRVLVKNSETQTGTTTVGTAAQLIDNASTYAVTGAEATATFWSDGTNWRVSVPIVSTSGLVPTSTTLTGSGAVKIAGDNSPHDLSANRTISFSGTDVNSSGVVTQLTGVANSVAIPVATALDWDSTVGPEIADVSNDLALRVRTAGASVKIFDGATLLGFFNYSGGSPYFQQFNGTGFQLIATGGDLSLRSQTAATGIDFIPGGSTVKGKWISVGLRLGDSGTAVEVADVGGRVHIGETTAPSTPADGATLWVDSGGYVHIKGKGGTDTVIAAP